MMDLFGGLLAPVKPPPAARKRPPPIVDDLVVDSGGLFDLSEVLCGARFQARFHSGASSYYDALGLVRARKDIGTVATLLNVSTTHLLRRYVSDGGRLFVDSGAFGAFQAWLTGTRRTAELDFEAVFRAYDAVIDGLAAAARENVWLVMPDIIGDHAGSLALLERYRERVLRYVKTNLNVIVPIQRGPCRAGETAELVFNILGTRKVVLGIPSKAAAMDVSDVATIRHDRFHVLGRCALTMQLYSRVYSFLEHNVGATVTCDANRIRACLPHISYEQAELIDEHEGGEWAGCFDDTELPFEVVNMPDWMTVPQITALAKAFGVQSKADIRNWIKAHKTNAEGLKHLIDEVDPEGLLLTSYAIPAAFGSAAREHLSARLRATAVERVFTS